MQVWRARRGLVERASDLGLVAVQLVLLIATVAALNDSWGGRSWVAGATLDAVLITAVWLRRRWPASCALAAQAAALLAVWWAAAAGLPSQPGPSAAFGLAVLVGGAVRRLSVTAATGIAAIGFTVVLAGWLSRWPAWAVSGITTLNLLIWAGAVVAGLSWRLVDDRRRAAVEEVRRSERLRLAAELHDTAAHHLTGIVLQAQAGQLLLRRLTGVDRTSAGDLEAALVGIERAGSEGLSAARELVGLLRDGGPAVPGDDLPQALTELVARFDRRRRAEPVRLELSGCPAAWPPTLAATVYRVVQEALTNIARHDPETPTVTVRVAEDHGSVNVDVVNQGYRSPTLRPRADVGYGLIGMRERVDALGGQFQAGPTGQGWALRAVLPLNRAAQP